MQRPRVKGREVETVHPNLKGVRVWSKYPPFWRTEGVLYGIGSVTLENWFLLIPIKHSTHSKHKTHDEIWVPNLALKCIRGKSVKMMMCDLQ